MVRKHYVSLALSALLIASTPAQATGWTAWAKGNFTGSTEYAHSIKTQKTTTLSGGGVRVRWGDLGTIRPVNITPPSFSVGCNGMDFSLGSISFMNFDEIVEKLKMVASAAPAFAFKMAIDTVCSQCATIMQDLEEIINMINNMSLDACKMAENIGNGVGQALGSTVADAGGGLFSDSYEAAKVALRNAAPYAAAVTNFVNNLDDITIKSRFYGSFLEYVKEHSSNQTVKNFIPHLATIAGDFGIVMPQNKEKPEVRVLARDLSEVKKLYKALLEPSEFNKYKTHTTTVTKHQNQPTNITWTATIEGLTPTTGLDSRFYDDMVTILQKMPPSGSELESDDLLRIRMLPKNGYQILNAIFVLGNNSGALNTAQEDYLKRYAKYAALEHFTETLNNCLNAVHQTVADYSKNLTITEEGKEGIAQMNNYVKTLGDVRRAIMEQHKIYLGKFKELDQNQYQRELEEKIKNSLK